MQYFLNTDLKFHEKHRTSKKKKFFKTDHILKSNLIKKFNAYRLYVSNIPIIFK